MVPQSEKDLKEFYGKLYLDPQRLQNMEYLNAINAHEIGNSKMMITAKFAKQYYKKSIMTAFDLAKWHDTNGVIQNVMRRCSYLANGKALDFGGGIGTNCMMISDYARTYKQEIHYYDICEFCRRFAEWRFRKYHFDIKILNELETDYDIIYMIDVIGHIVDKKKCLKDLIDRLKIGGQFIMTNDAVESKEHPMHIEFDFDFDGFMKSHNMHLVERRHLEIWKKVVATFYN